MLTLLVLGALAFAFFGVVALPFMLIGLLFKLIFLPIRLVFFLLGGLFRLVFGLLGGLLGLVLAPVMMRWVEFAQPKCDPPALIVAMIAAPIKLPSAEPSPPLRLPPPMGRKLVGMM